jgi:hypothetical protein
VTAGILLFLFGVVTAWLSLQIRVGTLRAPGSGFFPFYLGLLLVLLAAVHVARLWTNGGVRSGGEAADVRQGSPQRVLVFLAAMALGTGLLPILGYPLIAFLLMVLLLHILGVRPWLRLVTIALCTAGVCYVLFVRWLQIPLPSAAFWL